MSEEPSRDTRIDRAVRRLDRAATLLGQRISRRISEAQAQGGSKPSRAMLKKMRACPI